MAFINPFISAAMNLGLVAVIFVGALRVNAGMSETGKIIAFMNYLTIILHSMLAVTRMLTMLSKASASASRIEEVLNSPPELYELKSMYDKKSHSNPFIEFDHVTFQYETGKFKLDESASQLTRRNLLEFYRAQAAVNRPDSGFNALYDIQGAASELKESISDYALRSCGKIRCGLQNEHVFKDTSGENISLTGQ